jgi:sec-independent protein translocase protein TatA
MGFLGNLNGWHLIIIIAVIVLLFGAPKLPGLARSLGQSMRIFRGEMKTMKDEKNKNSEEEAVTSSSRTSATTSKAQSVTKASAAKSATTTARKPAAKKPSA